MENKEFKKIFIDTICKNGFETAFGAGFRESKDCIVVVSIQKSSYGNLFYLHVDIYVQGVFSKKYVINKDMVKFNLGTFSWGSPKEYEAIFDLDNSIDDSERRKKLDALFINYIIPFSNKASTLNGIKELVHNGSLYLLPAVKEELNKMGVEV